MLNQWVDSYDFHSNVVCAWAYEGILTHFWSFNFNVVLFKYLQVQILFEETFFNNENQSFAVLCIEQPLEGGIGMELFSIEYLF